MRNVVIIILGITMIVVGLFFTNNSPNLEGIPTRELKLHIGSDIPNWLDGVIAYDYEDGDLTNRIQLDSTEVDMNKLGTYHVYYKVVDNVGKETKQDLVVHIKDLKSPVISGVKPIIVELNNQKEVDYLSGVIAIDHDSGILTNDIKVDDTGVDYNKPGVYEIKYYVEDAFQNLSEFYTTVTVLEGGQSTVTKEVDVGGTINLLKSNNMNFIAGKPIFNEKFLEDYTFVRYDKAIRSSSTSWFDQTELDELISGINYRNKESLFKNSLINKVEHFKQSVTDIDNYVNEYYHVHYADFKTDRAFIQNFDYNHYGDEFYNKYLNDEYVSTLNKLQLGQITYKDFFDEYGTHLIKDAIFGERIEVFCAILSNNNDEVNDSIERRCTEISLNIPEGGGNSISLAKSDDLSYYSLSTRGGDSIVLHDEDTFYDLYSNWATYDIEEEKILSFLTDNEGLVPLWRLLPSEYAPLGKIMEEKYSEYINDET